MLKPDSLLGKRSRNEVSDQEFDDAPSEGAGSAAENEQSANIRRTKAKNRTLGATLETGFL